MSFQNIERNNNIDFIRGISILFVILLHINIHISIEQTAIGQYFTESINKILFHSGYYGVMMFFVVSGFLITSKSITRWRTLSRIEPVQFYLIRFARIAPLLLVLLLFLSIFDRLNIHGFVIDTTSLGQALFSALTFQINWLEAKTGYLPGAWDVLWSLSVEEMFYLIFPLACIFIRNRFAFIIILITFICLGPFARVAFTANDIWSDHSYLSCMDGIAFGCLAAIIAKEIQINGKIQRVIYWFGILLFLFIFVFRKQVFQLGLTEMGLNITLLEMSIALILISQYKNAVTNSNFIKPLRWLGKASYEIYLTHLFVLAIMLLFYNFFSRVGLIGIWYSLVIVLSGITGAVISKYFSEPINKFIRNYSKLPQQIFESNRG